jgi:hypothetical protein
MSSAGNEQRARDVIWAAGGSGSMVAPYFRAEATSSAAQQSHRMNILALFMLAPMALVATGGFSITIAAQNTPVIAAAADLQFELEEVAAQFKADIGRKVRLGFGASGDFVRQRAVRDVHVGRRGVRAKTR